MFKRACSFARNLGDAPEAVEGIKFILRRIIDGYPESFPESELDTTVQSALRTVRGDGELPGGEDDL